MPDTTQRQERPTAICARLLLRLHALSLQGKGSSPEAAVLLKEMESEWFNMTEQEQERLGGLSEDLYTLEDGGAKQIAMSPEEREQWSHAAQVAFDAYRAGDYDALLTFLRRPSPDDRPRHLTPYMQSRCWEGFGELEVAIVFMQEAERFDPQQAAHVLRLLLRAGHFGEATECAERIIRNPTADPVGLYFASVALLTPTRKMTDSEANPILSRVAEVLRRALRTPRGSSPEHQGILRLEAAIASTLGLCLERLGEQTAALKVYNETLAHIRDPELLTLRGISRYDTDTEAALSDFQHAREMGALTIWPYYFLAHHAVTHEKYLEAWQLCLAGLERGGPENVRAILYEWLGIARSMLGQSIGVVLESFDRAELLDPGNPRIRQNRAIAESYAARLKPGERRWGVPKAAITKAARREWPSSLGAQQEFWSAQRGEEYAAQLIGAP